MLPASWENAKPQVKIWASLWLPELKASISYTIYQNMTHMDYLQLYTQQSLLLLDYLYFHFLRRENNIETNAGSDSATEIHHHAPSS